MCPASKHLSGYFDGARHWAKHLPCIQFISIMALGSNIALCLCVTICKVGTIVMLPPGTTMVCNRVIGVNLCEPSSTAAGSSSVLTLPASFTQPDFAQLCLFSTWYLADAVLQMCCTHDHAGAPQ